MRNTGADIRLLQAPLVEISVYYDTQEGRAGAVASAIWCLTSYPKYIQSNALYKLKSE